MAKTERITEEKWAENIQQALKEVNRMNYEKALQIATEAHKGQKRKYSGLDYITHPIAVAAKFEDEDYKIVAVLHDTVEDSDLTLIDLKENGLHGFLVYILDDLTKKPGEPYSDYIMRVKHSKMATKIKIEDLKHNLSDLKDGCLKDKYQLALRILTL